MDRGSDGWEALGAVSPGSTPWPGWPESRLIPARFNLENCFSQYTDRVTMDTTTWPARWRKVLRPGWWHGNASGLATRHGNSQERLLRVDNTLHALQRLASRVCENWRKAGPGRLIGAVAGSVGKTTTKEILAALVGARFRTLKTQGNLNNEYGLPLTLLRLDENYEAAVVELGMSHRGELAASGRGLCFAGCGA